MALVKILTAPIWITAFLIADVVIPFVRGTAGLVRGAWKQVRAGDAQWASDKVLKKNGHLTPGGIPIGVTLKSRKRIYAHPESSVLMIATKGMGKSQTFIAIGKSLKDRPVKPDLVFVDPKGELRRALSADLTAMGYDIAAIDIYEPENGGKYDPLGFARPDDRWGFDRDVKALCELIVPDDVNSRQPHFAEFSRLLFREIVTAAMRHGNKKTIGECVTDLLNKDKLDALIERLRAEGDPDAMAALMTFEKMYGRPEGNSMLSTSLRKLELWRMAAIKEISSFGPSDNPLRPRGWTWDDVFDHPKPMAMFIRTGLGTNGGDFVRLAVGSAINTARRRWNDSGTPLRKGLWLIVDEARSMGYCNAIMDANNELRSAGIVTLLCFLTMADVHKTYGDDADTLLSQCVNVVFGQSDDFKYYEYVSKKLGTKTDYSHGESEQDGRKGQSRHETKVPLMSAAEIGALPYSQFVARLRGLNVHGRKLFEATPGKPVRYF